MQPIHSKVHPDTKAKLAAYLTRTSNNESKFIRELVESRLNGEEADAGSQKLVESMSRMQEELDSIRKLVKSFVEVSEHNSAVLERVEELRAEMRSDIVVLLKVILLNLHLFGQTDIPEEQLDSLLQQAYPAKRATSD